MKINTKKVAGLPAAKQSKNGNKNFNPDDFLIEPTTEARLQFIKEFVPKWMVEFEGDDWEIAHRLSEEIEENFQFVDKSSPVKVHDGLLRQGPSVAHIIVMQQLEIIEQRIQISAMQLVAEKKYKKLSEAMKEYK
jgi:hypothetical protein